MELFAATLVRVSDMIKAFCDRTRTNRLDTFAPYTVRLNSPHLTHGRSRSKNRWSEPDSKERRRHRSPLTGAIADDGQRFLNLFQRSDMTGPDQHLGGDVSRRRGGAV